MLLSDGNKCLFMSACCIGVQFLQGICIAASELQKLFGHYQFYRYLLFAHLAAFSNSSFIFPTPGKPVVLNLMFPSGSMTR